MEDFLNLAKEDDFTKSRSIYDKLYEKYVLANKMRAWYIEKKKNVDEALEKQSSKNNNINEQPSQPLSDIITKVVDQAIAKCKFI